MDRLRSAGRGDLHRCECKGQDPDEWKHPMLAAGEPVLDCFKRENEFTRYLRVSAGADSLSASVSVTLSDQILKFLLRASKCLNRVSTRTRLAFLISSPPAGIWTAASDGRLTRVDSEATGKLLLCSSFTAPQPEKNVISKVFHLCLPCLFKLAVRAAPHAYHSGSRLHIKQTAQLRRGVRCRLLFWVERGQNGLAQSSALCVCAGFGPRRWADAWRVSFF